MVTLTRFGVASRLLLLFAVGSTLALVRLAGQPAQSPERVLVAGVETHALPFTGADPKGQPVGFSVEMLQAVARDQGLKIKFVVLPWSELLAEFRAGRIDIICNIVDTPERQKFMGFSVTTAHFQGGLFVRKDQPPISTLADLTGRRIAVLKDSRAHQYIQQHGWNVQLDFVPTLQEALDAVHNGRSDLLLANHLVTNDLIKRRGYRDIVASEIRLKDFDYRGHFGVQLDQRELLARLDAGLLNLHLNGTSDHLHEKRIGPIQDRSLRFADLRPYLLPLATLVLVLSLAFVWQRRIVRQISRQIGALRQSEKRLSLVFEGSQDGFWDWDVRLDKVQRSPRWAGMLGYTLEEIGTTRIDFVDLIHPDDREKVRIAVRELWKNREHSALEFRMRAKSGEWKWILDRGKVVARDPITREPLRVAGTHSDITARKHDEEESARLQGKLLETEKLESLGVLAGGIAHDFNNLLTVILGNTSLARLDPAITPENSNRLEKIAAATKRAAHLCRQLLAYAGKENFTIVRLDLNQLIRETTSLLHLSISRQAHLEFSLADSLPEIDADPSQIRQVIVNLVLNASEALGDGSGAIRIVSRSVLIGHLGLPGCLPSGGLPPGEFVCLEICDPGCGMSPAVLERIFDPFYSSKFTGRGLGLPAVLGIVRSHHGAIKVSSRLGMGSTFQVFLPAAKDSPANRSAGPIPPTLKLAE